MGEASKTRTCFVIAPIGTTDSDVRKRSDKVLKHIFKDSLVAFHNCLSFLLVQET